MRNSEKPDGDIYIYKNDLLKNYAINTIVNGKKNNWVPMVGDEEIFSMEGIKFNQFKKISGIVLSFTFLNRERVMQVIQACEEISVEIEN